MRIARHLQRRGLLVCDAENAYLGTEAGEEDGLAAVVGHSITYRIAVGPNEGRKAFTLQTVPPALEAPSGEQRLAKHSGSCTARMPPARRQRPQLLDRTGVPGDANAQNPAKKTRNMSRLAHVIWLL